MTPLYTELNFALFYILNKRTESKFKLSIWSISFRGVFSDQISQAFGISQNDERFGKNAALNFGYSIAAEIISKEIMQ